MSLNSNSIKGTHSNNSNSATQIQDLIDFNPFNISYRWSIFEVSVLILITATSLVANGSVIYMIFRRKALHRQYYIFILNLAFVNFIYAACNLPLSIVSSILYEWPFGKLFCRASAWINFSLSIECFGTLIMIHIDRIVAVYFPIWYSRLNMKPRNVFRGSATLIVGTWAVSLCLSMGLWVLEHSVHYDFLRLACLPYFMGQTTLILSGITVITVIVVFTTVLQAVATYQHNRRIARIAPVTVSATSNTSVRNEQGAEGNQQENNVRACRYSEYAADAERFSIQTNDPNGHVKIPRVHYQQAITGAAATCILLITWLPFVVGIYRQLDMDVHVAVFTAILWYTTGLFLFFLFASTERKIRAELLRHCNGCSGVL